MLMLFVFQQSVQHTFGSVEPGGGDDALPLLAGDSSADGSGGRPLGLPALLHDGVVGGEVEVPLLFNSIQTLFIVQFSFLKKATQSDSQVKTKIKFRLFAFTEVSHTFLKRIYFGSLSTSGCQRERGQSVEPLGAAVCVPERRVDRESESVLLVASAWSCRKAAV